MFPWRSCDSQPGETCRKGSGGDKDHNLPLQHPSGAPHWPNLWVRGRRRKGWTSKVGDRRERSSSCQARAREGGNWLIHDQRHSKDTFQRCEAFLWLILFWDNQKISDQLFLRKVSYLFLMKFQRIDKRCGEMWTSSTASCCAVPLWPVSSRLFLTQRWPAGVCCRCCIRSSPPCHNWHPGSVWT